MNIRDTIEGVAEGVFAFAGICLTISMVVIITVFFIKCLNTIIPMIWNLF